MKPTGANAARAIAAEQAFRARLGVLGATLLEPSYLGSRTPHHVRCAAGHDCYPMPCNLQKPGRGICRTCAGHDPADAEVRFRARLAEFGAVLTGAYAKNDIPVGVRCAQGHEFLMSWASLQNSTGPCRICAGHDPATAAAAFRARLTELGATLMEPEWLGARTPHHVVCAAGHDCHPQPLSVQQGRGVCKTCAGNDPAVSEAAFRARLAGLGAEPLYTEWRGVDSPHHVRCPQGHDCYPSPGHVRDGRGICRTCAGQDPEAAEAAFRATLAAAGATLIEPGWLGNNRPHRICCADGHDAAPYPGNVQQGGGICGACAGRAWDVFYVLTHTADHRVKFGITNGEGRARLWRHAQDGYEEVIRLVTDLPGTTAIDTERAVKSALALAGELPVQGKEYFDISCLALILDVADSWLAA